MGEHWICNPKVESSSLSTSIMYCPNCGHFIEDSTLASGIFCPKCLNWFWVENDIPYGQMLEDGFNMLNPYDDNETI